MIRFIFLIFVLAASPACSAQPEPPDASFWLDDLNIRHHVHSESVGLFSFTGIYANRTATEWDSAGKRYRSAIPLVLRYNALARTPYRTVHAAHIGPPGYDLQWNFDGMPAAQIAGRMDTLLAKHPLRNRMMLRYDDEGRLVLKQSWRDDADIAFEQDHSSGRVARTGHRDSFSYTCSPAGHALIEWKRLQHYELLKMSGWDSAHHLHRSACCDTIRSLPYMDRRLVVHRWEINDQHLVSAHRLYAKAWVNDCLYEPCPALQDSTMAVRRYRYDAHGRLLSEIWTRAGKPDLLLEAHTYKDRRPDEQYGPMQVPLMRQYLDRIRNPHMTIDDYHTYSYDPAVLAGSRPDTVKPYVHHGTEVIVSDAAGQRLRFHAEKWQDDVRVYMRAADSSGPYRIHVRLSGIDKNTDTAIYDPRRWRVSHTLTGGDNVRTIYERPRGAFTAGRIDFADRVVLRPEDSLHMIAYGADNMGIYYDAFGPPLDFWAPQESRRYQNAAVVRENFVIVDARGLVRFVYNDGHIYRLTYE